MSPPNNGLSHCRSAHSHGLTSSWLCSWHNLFYWSFRLSRKSALVSIVLHQLVEQILTAPPSSPPPPPSFPPLPSFPPPLPLSPPLPRLLLHLVYYWSFALLLYYQIFLTIDIEHLSTYIIILYCLLIKFYNFLHENHTILK